MDTGMIIRRIIIFLVSGHTGVSSLIIQTEDVVIRLQRDNSIILNCTYYEDKNEEIRFGNIKWQKQIEIEFKDIAMFAAYSKPFILKDKQPLYNNRTELIAPNTSNSAVMIMADPVCSDMGKYRCQIEYISDSSPKKQTSDATVKSIAKAKTPDEFVVYPNELEENQSISLTCSADVGSPLGYIKIWKFFKNSSSAELIYTFNSTSNKTDDCTEYINVNITYTVTREDNGASFRCSSQNEMTQGPGPSKDSQQISVLYGPDESSIKLIPDKSEYLEGDRLTIQCSTDSNPPPLFVWRFQPHNKNEDKSITSSNKSKIEFDDLQYTHSGTYICTAVNENRSNSPNATSYEAISVRNSERKYTCDQCGYTDTCQLNNGKTSCTPNPWVPVAVVFIFLSATFAVSTILIWQRKQRQKSDSANRTVVSQRSPSSNAIPEDTHGVYSSPNDLIRMQENSSLLTHHTEADGYTTTGDVVQYAAVQKRTTEDNQVSEDKVYDSAWN